MPTCLHCHGRKGKRECPALRGKICAACCGEHRLTEIDCPADCTYLGNESYQRRRRLDRAPDEWIRHIMRYERKDRASQAIFHEMNLALCGAAADRRGIDKREAREALEFARRRMSLIETPEPYVPPLGERLLEALDRLIRDEAAVEREGVRQVLDQALDHLDREIPEGRFEEYLSFLRAVYGDPGQEGRQRDRSSLIVP